MTGAATGVAMGAHSRAAHAQAQLVPSDATKGAEAKDINGWNPFLSLTSTLSLTSNAHVVGQVDGFSTLFGLGLLGGADYVNDRHLFRSTLTIAESVARTSVVDRFVKVNDDVKLEGLYNYFFTKYLGLYGRLGVATAILPSYDVRGESTSWVDASGDVPTALETGTMRQQLASAFEPFTLRESLGAFADPIREDELNLSLRLGVGGRHTFAEGVLANNDNEMTPEIELVRLSDVHQLGFEAFAGVTGKLGDGKANYKAGLAILVPAINNDSFDRGPGELTRVAFEGNLTYAVNAWLSIVYSVAITRDPQLFPEDKELVQMQNTLLATFQVNLVKKQEAPAGKSKEQTDLEAAVQRAEAAEQRANAAEDKLRQLQPSEAPPEPAPPPPPAEPAKPELPDRPPPTP